MYQLYRFLCLTCSNAIKFTHEGKVGINLYVVPEPSNVMKQDSQSSEDLSMSQSKDDKKGEDSSELKDTSNGPERDKIPMGEDGESRDSLPEERIVWIRCDVYDTGIGIPGTNSNS